MEIKSLMIAAPKSGSGKTTVTCGLLQVLKNQGKQVTACKCGPDYIDPMFHETVLGVPSYNLDTFFTGEEYTRELFMEYAAKGEYVVLEGVMGLYDGLGGIREEGSSYHLAKVTGTPIVLVVDAKGMGRSLAALLAGFLQYDTERLIRGVILNRVSKSYYETIAGVVEKELGLRMLGFLPEQKEFHIESRHLGLVMPEELTEIKENIIKLSAEFEKTILYSELLKIAEGGKKPGRVKAVEKSERKAKNGGKKPPVIAVARDEAFCFYYRENLLMLEKNGAVIQYFSPLHDKELPKGCGGLLIGGGYPELYAKKLSENVPMQISIKEAVKKGVPVVAECGGFMYLQESLTDKEGVRHNMAGVIPGESFDTGKPVRFGYIEIQEKNCCFLPEGEKIKGHEFHYYDSSDNGNDALAIKPLTGRSYSCIMEGENYWMGFPHLYYPSNPAFAKAFVGKVRKYMEKQIRV